MSCCALEIPIRREQLEFVPNAQLCEQGVHGADLNASAPADITKFSRADMVVAIRDEQRQCAESINDVLAGARAAKSLKELLQHEAGGHDRVRACEGSPKRRDLRRTRLGITTECERPDARVDEQRH